ncbi:MAG: cobalamin biosynthesis protein, partial [Oscillospiraceae bacterium]|nr:cobalamin biosynthesis protein [Oscillospiraceae bacterium]
MSTLIAILIGFILDFILGDPAWLPHPVVGIGKAISFWERQLRRFPVKKGWELFSGALLVFFIAVPAFSSDTPPSAPPSSNSFKLPMPPPNVLLSILNGFDSKIATPISLVKNIKTIVSTAGTSINTKRFATTPSVRDFSVMTTNVTIATIERYNGTAARNRSAISPAPLSRKIAAHSGTVTAKYAANMAKKIITFTSNCEK